MSVSELTFRLIVVFYPGLLCAYIVDILTTRPKREKVYFILHSYAFGMAIYALFAALMKLGHSEFPAVFPDGVLFFDIISNGKTALSFSELIYVSVFAVLFSLLWSTASNNKWGHRLCNWMGVSRRFGDVDVWSYVLNAKDDSLDWVCVRNHDTGLVYEGYIRAFGDNYKDPELLLEDVSVYMDDGNKCKKLYQVGAMYLRLKGDAIVMEFRNFPIDSQALWAESDTDDTPVAGEEGEEL